MSKTNINNYATTKKVNESTKVYWEQFDSLPKVIRERISNGNLNYSAKFAVDAMVELPITIKKILKERYGIKNPSEEFVYNMTIDAILDIINDTDKEQEKELYDYYNGKGKLWEKEAILNV